MLPRINRLVLLFLLALLALIAGSKQYSPRPGLQAQAARPLLAASQPPGPPATVAVSAQPAAVRTTSASQTASANQLGAASEAAPTPDNAEERRSTFSLAGQTFTAVMHFRHPSGKTGANSQALESLDILDAAGAVQRRESLPLSVENGEFAETCSVNIQVLHGSNGQGLLLDTGCLPSAPLGGGPWQILGMSNGKLVPIGKPIVTEGQLGEFVPGEIKKLGSITQILRDILDIRVWTGYFFAMTPVRVNWLEGKLAPGQRCFYQTGHGFADDGCEMPAEDIERRPMEQDMTFVRLFPESNERIGPPAHVVVKKDSKVEILSGKSLITWQEENGVIHLGVGDDVWVKVRIDGKIGWIHTVEDLSAIGLYQSG